MNSTHTTAAKPSLTARLAGLAKHRTLRIALVSSLLLFASFPPLGLWPLAWIAPVPWLWLARFRELPGRRPYGALWSACFVFWLAVHYWLCLPHWATSFGWLTLAGYHGFLAPLVVGFARIAQARWRVSLLVSAPVLWVAFDAARAYLFTGFSMGSLSHSQYRQTWVIQAADVCGEFGVTFLMVLAAAAIARALPTPDDRRWSFAPPAAAAAAVGLLLGYGYWRIDDAPAHVAPGPKLALIQGSIDSEFKHDPLKQSAIYSHYFELSKQAVAADPQVQLVVWPETMFPFPWMVIEPDATVPPDVPLTLDELNERAAQYRAWVVATARALERPLLLGISTTEFGRDRLESFNSALLVDRNGTPQDRYDKQHLVIFGEYVPLAKTLPFLYKLTPLTGGTEEGAEAKAFDFAGVRLAPSICYETAMARVIRRQVVELRAKGQEPDVLVNVTNDGWFWGSSELDLHLACGVFRAVEHRKPLVIAANTGFSAHIDSSGRILAQGPRRSEGFINAAVTLDRRRSFYSTYGDWLPQACLALAVVAGIGGLWDRRRRRSAAA